MSDVVIVGAGSWGPPSPTTRPGAALRLSWAGEPTEPASDEADAADRRMVGPSEIATLEPHLLTPPGRAVHIPADAGVDPAQATRALVQAARDHGARVVLEEPVVAVDRRRDRVVGVRTATRRHRSETVVLAAGTAVPALCAPLGVDVPVHESPALLLRASAPAGMVRTVVATDDFEVREITDGQLVMTAPVAADTSPSALSSAARRAVRSLASTFEGGHDVRPTVTSWGVARCHVTTAPSSVGTSRRRASTSR